jgi:6-pyruvoyltetrahydropterin/6-carboxytetrahydropterin synthase
MYKINVSASFPGAHFLSGYDGVCKNLHGHNWQVRVQLASQTTDELGMAIDFKVVKEHLNALMDRFDHQHLNELDWFANENPTSENIAKVIFHELKRTLSSQTIRVNEVEVWESNSTSVIYSE